MGLSLQHKINSNLKEGYDDLNEIPGYSIWEYFWTDLGKRNIPLLDKLAWSFQDTGKITTKLCRSLKNKALC
jgi:hypothetical protein